MSTSRKYPWQYHGETLVVDTPEQTRVEFRVAPFGGRLAAALIDNAIVFGIGIAMLCLVLATGGVGVVHGYLVAIAVVLFFLASMFYFVLAEWNGDGRTFGKRKLGLRAIMATGHGLTLGAALMRNLARLVDNVPLLWLVPAISKGRRRIGDLLAGTFVIEEARAAPSSEPWLDKLAPSWRALSERRFGAISTVHDALSIDDLDLLEYLGERLRAVPALQRRQTLSEIALRYVQRLALENERAAVEADPERFLQELGLYLRDRFENVAR